MYMDARYIIIHTDILLGGTSVDVSFTDDIAIWCKY